MKKGIILLVILMSINRGWAQKLSVITVDGKIDADSVGFALPHEHIMSNFGADPKLVGSYDEEALMQQVVPYLKKLRTMRVATIFEGTAAYFGRNVALLQRISKATGMQIVTNTGFYAAANDRYVPEMAYDANAMEIAQLWITEFWEGIDGKAIAPGFVKLAFDDGTPSEIDLKLFEAGILAHKETGLTLAVHTGDNTEAVRRQLELLKKHEVSPNAWIWIHANKTKNDDFLLEAAASGAWISLDGANDANIDDYLERIALFKKAKLLDRLLLSHDGNAFPSGGSIRQFQAVPELLVPKLKKNGFTQDDIQTLLVENPKRAYAIRIRKM